MVVLPFAHLSNPHGSNSSVSQTIKDVNQALVDDGLVDCDKVPTSNTSDGVAATSPDLLSLATSY